MTRRKRTKAERAEGSPHPGRKQGGNVTSIESIGHTYKGYDDVDHRREQRAESEKFSAHISNRMTQMREAAERRRQYLIDNLMADTGMDEDNARETVLGYERKTMLEKVAQGE